MEKVVYFSYARNDQPMAMHGVQHILRPLTPLPAWPDNDHRSKIVFITRDMERETVERIFKVITQVARRGQEAFRE